MLANYEAETLLHESIVAGLLCAENDSIFFHTVVPRRASFVFFNMQKCRPSKTQAPLTMRARTYVLLLL